MYPVALVGLAAIVLAVVNAFAHNEKTKWVISLLVLTVVVGMVGAFFKMSFALDYIAAGPEGRKFWMPMTMSALGVLPPYLATMLAAIGSGLLGLSGAYRNRKERQKAFVHLVDGFIGCSVLICFTIIIDIVPQMLVAAMDVEDFYTAMAKGMATSVSNVIWPAAVSGVLLLARIFFLSARHSD
jgi:hypothetical protein